MEYLDETWFVWVPPAGVMNPETGYGWSPAGKPLKNRATRRKGQRTWSCYLSLDAKEDRLAWQWAPRTNSWATCQFLYDRLWSHEQQGHRVLVLIWDNASWHVSRALRQWMKGHNQRVRKLGVGVRIVPVCLPVHAFWLNQVETEIGQAKQRVLPCRQFASPEAQRGALDRHWLHRNLKAASTASPADLIPVLH